MGKHAGDFDAQRTIQMMLNQGNEDWSRGYNMLTEAMLNPNLIETPPSPKRQTARDVNDRLRFTDSQDLVFPDVSPEAPPTEPISSFNMWNPETGDRQDFGTKEDSMANRRTKDSPDEVKYGLEECRGRYELSEIVRR